MKTITCYLKIDKTNGKKQLSVPDEWRPCSSPLLQVLLQIQSIDLGGSFSDLQNEDCVCGKEPHIPAAQRPGTVQQTHCDKAHSIISSRSHLIGKYLEQVENQSSSLQRHPEESVDLQRRGLLPGRCLSPGLRWAWSPGRASGVALDTEGGLTLRIHFLAI